MPPPRRSGHTCGLFGGVRLYGVRMRSEEPAFAVCYVPWAGPRIAGDPREKIIHA